MFTLDSKLAADTHYIGRLPLSKVLLFNDRRYPWVILVPAYPDLYEMYHLSKKERQQLMEEVNWVSEKLADAYSADSMNVGALGNVVSQLHIHCVVRHNKDAAWPGPVWGHSAAEVYSETGLETRVGELKALLGSHFIDESDTDQYVPDSTVYW